MPSHWFSGNIPHLSRTPLLGLKEQFASFVFQVFHLDFNISTEKTGGKQQDFQNSF